MKRGILAVYFCVFVSLLNMNLSCQRIATTPDTPAVFQGEYDMGWVINHYMIYPKSEQKVNRAGIVEISWIVNKLGEVEKVKAALQTNNKPAQSAIARKKIKGKEVLPINQAVIDNLIHSITLLQFTPAKKNGRATNSTMSTSIEFVLI